MTSSTLSLRERRIAFFASLCLFLSAVEYAIPKPLPFMRIGLANLPIIISLLVFTRRETLLLAALKVLSQALISGTLFSYVLLFSACGTFASVLTMMALYTVFQEGREKKEKNALIGTLGITVAGSLANNLAQLALARFFLFGEGTRYIAPLLLGTGFVSGIVLGSFCTLFIRKSSWLNSLKAEAAQ